MSFSFHPEAYQELLSTIDYYESIQSGLGIRFVKEIFSTIERILRYPEAAQQLSQNSRRCLVNKFPIGLIYQIHDGDILIIAIAHLNRKPGFWENRD